MQLAARKVGGWASNLAILKALNTPVLSVKQELSKEVEATLKLAGAWVASEEKNT